MHRARSREKPFHLEMFYNCSSHISVLLKSPSFKRLRKNPLSVLEDIVAVSYVLLESLTPQHLPCRQALIHSITGKTFLSM